MLKKTKQIILIETLYDGHHQTYIKLLTKTFLELGFKVITFCPEPDDLSQWLKDNKASNLEFFQAFLLTDASRHPLFKKIPLQSLQIILNWLITARKLKKNKLKPDLVFLAWLSRYLDISPKVFFGNIFYQLNYFSAKYFFPYSWSGLYNNTLDNWNIFQLKNCKNLAVFDFSLIPFLEEKLKKKIIYFPDFTDEAEPDENYQVVKEINSLAKGRKIVSLLGGLQQRKGMITLLKTAEILKNKPFYFVFAGSLGLNTFSNEEQEYIKSLQENNPENCFFYFARIPDESKFNALVKNSDLLFAAYLNFPNSSNMPIKAALFEKPLIVSQGYYLEKIVEKYSLGFAIKEGCPDSCAKAIRKLAEEGINSPEFSSYRELQSLESLKKALMEIVS